MNARHNLTRRLDERAKRASKGVFFDVEVYLFALREDSAQAVRIRWCLVK